MREIKFRAFDKKDNEMFYSSMYQDKTSMAYGLGNFLSEYILKEINENR